MVEREHCPNCGIKTIPINETATYEECLCEQCYTEDEEFCILCGGTFTPGETGNELGFCMLCMDDPNFPYDLDKYYEDHDNGKVAFKGFETMERGLLEAYRRK